MKRRTLFAATISLCLVIANSVRADPASSSPAAALQASIDSANEPIFDGLGNLHHPVTSTTKSPLAQKFFDQGLSFIYAYNHDEATGSFKQAAHLDPGMAM